MAVLNAKCSLYYNTVCYKVFILTFCNIKICLKHVRATQFWCTSLASCSPKYTVMYKVEDLLDRCWLHYFGYVAVTWCNNPLRFYSKSWMAFIHVRGSHGDHKCVYQGLVGKICWSNWDSTCMYYCKAVWGFLFSPPFFLVALSGNRFMVPPIVPDSSQSLP